MARTLAFGNGDLLVQIDPYGCIRELCYPVGRFNHLLGRPIRTGVWVDGAFSWCSDQTFWSHEQHILSVRPLAAREVWTSFDLQLTVTVHEHLDGAGFWRRYRVSDATGRHRAVKLFVNEHLQIMEGPTNDCVVWQEPCETLVHYKEDIGIGFRGLPVADQVAVGHIGIKGLVGTGLDAEDGELVENPIDVGNLDATMRFSLDVPHGGYGELVLRLSPEQYPVTPEAFMVPDFCESAHSYNPLDLHLSVMRTQIASSGAVLAANDSDVMVDNRLTYGSCWPRDAAHVADIFLEAGFPEISDNFLAFMSRALERHPEYPWAFQKYTAQGYLANGWHPWRKQGHARYPFQQDETACLVSLAWRLRESGRELERSAQETLVLRPLKFLLDHRDETGLPKPSFDLWEERYGVHVYTVAIVIKALEDGSKYTGDPRYQEAADQMREALLARFWLPDLKHFMRRIDENGFEDHTIDASSLHVGLMGVLPIGDPRVVSNANTVMRRLWVNSEVGGIARYQDDYYFKVSDRYPGNPWIICTLWVAQHRALAGDAVGAQELIDWVDRTSASSGLLSEQLHPETGSYLSVSPLTWSHAEYAKALLLLGRLTLA